jgi:hypothetical protein
MFKRIGLGFAAGYLVGSRGSDKLRDQLADLGSRIKEQPAVSQFSDRAIQALRERSQHLSDQVQSFLYPSGEDEGDDEAEDERATAEDDGTEAFDLDEREDEDSDEDDEDQGSDEGDGRGQASNGRRDAEDDDSEAFDLDEDDEDQDSDEGGRKKQAAGSRRGSSDSRQGQSGSRRREPPKRNGQHGSFGKIASQVYERGRVA